MAGRPPNPKRETANYLIRFPDSDFINELDVIAKREGIKRRELILRFLREGMEKHAPGNPQTLLNSYVEGGAQTINQLVGRIRQEFYSQGEVLKRDILAALKSEGIKGMERVNMADSIASWLREQGKKVYE